MENLLASIAAKHAELDQLRIRAPGGTTNFDHSQDLELTYTSNAIEGNTLSAADTTMVIEQGITVAGKPLRLCKARCNLGEYVSAARQALPAPRRPPGSTNGSPPHP